MFAPFLRRPHQQARALLLTLGILIVGVFCISIVQSPPTHVKMTTTSRPRERLKPVVPIQTESNNDVTDEPLTPTPDAATDFFFVDTYNNNNQKVVIKGKDRSSSAPFITGDGFRLCADIICDETTSTSECEEHPAWFTSSSPSSSSSNLVVFVKTDAMRRILSMKAPNPPAAAGSRRPWVLVTHNSDFTSPWEAGNVRAKNGVIGKYEEQRARFLRGDNETTNHFFPLRWYAQNAAISHKYLTPIPIGLENRYNKYGAHVEKYWQTFYRTHFENDITKPRDRLLYVNFNLKTNTVVRKKMLEAATRLQRKSPNEVTIWESSGPKSKLTIEGYLTALEHHDFVLCPLGHGLDTHRVWEALYAGAIPVTLTSPLDTLLTSQLNDFPVVVLNSVEELTTERLEAERRKFRSAAAKHMFLNKRLALSTWCDAIRKGE